MLELAWVKALKPLATIDFQRYCVTLMSSTFHCAIVNDITYLLVVFCCLSFVLKNIHAGNP